LARHDEGQAGDGVPDSIALVDAGALFAQVYFRPIGLASIHGRRESQSKPTDLALNKRQEASITLPPFRRNFRVSC